MPISKKEGESKNDFISRCIKHEVNKGKEQEQASAICYNIWESMRRIEEKLRTIRQYRKRA